MERFAQVVLQNSKTLLDALKVYENKIQAKIAQNQTLEAIHIALEVLKQLGVKFPKKPNKFHTLLGFAQTQLSLAAKPRIDIS